MTNVVNSGEAVRIQVIQHCSGEGGSQCCKFSVDPQLTSLSVLHNLVARAFKISREFETSYLARDDRLPEAVWLPLLSDFDLELAFTRSSEPHLLVKVEFGRSGSASGGSVGGVIVWGEGLDLIPRLPLPDLAAAATANNYSARLPGLFREKMEKTFGLMQKALNWQDELGGEGGVPGQVGGQQPPPPLDDKRFQSFLDNVGVLERAEDLRKTVYLAGLEPSLRKVAWKHLLDVYPAGLTGRERLDYMKSKSQEYYVLRDTWQQHIKKTEGQACGEVLSISNMVRKDVLRTDRQHPHFSGPDDNPNTTALYNILTTYSLNHPSVGYCQGMSDLASPLLVTQRDEAHAYVCFCALMSRTHPNFHIDGVAMSLKFQHLSEALIYYDPEFYIYLQEHQADDLLFCYRWLLLELKREFAFDEAQLMLEVLWASLPSRPPQDEGIQLCQVAFNPGAALQAAAAGVTSNTSPTYRGIAAPSSSVLSAARLAARGTRISNYGTVCALRRQRSSEAAAVLSRYTRNVRSALGGGRALTRTHSQPTHACLTRGALPAISPAVEATASTVADEEATAAIEGDVGCKLVTSRDEAAPSLHQAKVPAAELNVVLPPLSDDVFLTDAPTTAIKVRTVDAVTNPDSCSVAEAECNVTPTRKIKNLKEFMELGKGCRSSDSCSNPESPSKSPSKKTTHSPRKVNSDKAVPNSLNFKCAAQDTRNHSEPCVHSVSCTRVNSDHNTNTVTSTTTNHSDSSIPSCIPASRYSDACNGPISNTGRASYQFNGCLTVDNRKYPPSGLSPIESPCEDTLVASFGCISASNGNRPSPASSGCHDDADRNSSVPVTTSLEVSPGCASSYSPTHCTSSAANAVISNSSTSTTLASSSSSSSALCAADITRRCFSESDAGLGMRLDDDTDCVLPQCRADDNDGDDEQLCVEVWENPLASSPIRGGGYVGYGSNKTAGFPESCTEGDIAKLMASQDGSSENQNIPTKLVSNQQIPFKSLSPDTADSTFNIMNGKHEATSALIPSENKCKGLGSTANTGWTVSLGGTSSSSTLPSKLAPPHQFGGGNPFLMIVCVTILLQHRNFIVSQRLDHNDLAMHFDKMVRKHNVHDVLRHARLRYQHYLGLHKAGSSGGHEAC